MSLFGELKRRNVVRVAVAYLAAAWLVTQVTGTVLPAFGYGESELRVIIIVLAIALVPVLVLSWVFEVMPEGIVVDKEAEPDRPIARVRGRRMDFIIISLLAAAVLVFAYDKWWGPGLSVRSIAVLPINALSADPEVGYLADSLTADLHAELGRIAGLTVRSSQSAGQYRASDKMLPEIARELVFDALIEGSIRSLGDQVRVNLQLIDGRTDSQLWSGPFDRYYGDILTQQGEVARAIASAIEISLTPQTEAGLGRDRSTSREVIAQWAIGYHYFRELTPDSFRKAIEAFEEAVRLDPEFAEGYAGLALIYQQQGGWFGSEEAANVLPLARQAAETAIRLDPALAAAHAALAGTYLLSWDWGNAERAYRRAVELDQSN